MCAVLTRSACQNAPRRVDSNSFQNGVGRVETKGSARHGARQSEQPAGATLERHPCCLGRRGRASSPGAVGARHVRGGGLAADRVRSRRAHGSLSTVCGTSCADPRAWRPLAFLRSARASAARVQSGCHWHCSIKRGHYRVAEVEELVLQGEHAAHTTSASRDSSILDAKLVHPRVVGVAVSHLNERPDAGVQSNSRSTESRC